MSQTDKPSHPAKGKGKAFFDRADQVAETGNWDFAIEMYIEGIKREPENIERGHQPLREVALRRKAAGGKGPGMMESLKRRVGKDALANLTNAEYLLAKDPGSVAHMEQALKAAKAMKAPELIQWIGNILLESQRQAEKPNKRILVQLTQAYNDIEKYASAIQACELAIQSNPDDATLHEALRELGAKYTIQQGQYDQEGDFTRSVKDLEKQKELIQKDALAQSHEYLIQQIDHTRKEYEESPTVPGKINAFVDALLKVEDETYENEAIDVLNKGYRDTKAYQLKMRVGDIKIRQMTRRYRKLVDAGDKAAAAKHRQEQLQFELQEFTERAENYPTDLSIKYEMGRRLLIAGKLDEAIASLQQAQRDPRRHITAMGYLGQAFARKGWHQEAAETFARALEQEMSDERAKDIRYHLGDALESLGKLKEAQEQFSQVAQMDYNYKNVRQRVEKIRELMRRMDDEEPRKSPPAS